MKHFRRISDRQLKKMLESTNPPLLIDVRDEDEFCNGHIRKSKNIPIEIFEETIRKMHVNKNTVIVVYCQTGVCSLIACNILKDLGFDNIYNFKGINNWHYDLRC